MRSRFLALTATTRPSRHLTGILVIQELHRIGPHHGGTIDCFTEVAQSHSAHHAVRCRSVVRHPVLLRFALVAARTCRLVALQFLAGALCGMREARPTEVPICYVNSPCNSFPHSLLSIKEILRVSRHGVPRSCLCLCGQLCCFHGLSGLHAAQRRTKTCWGARSSTAILPLSLDVGLAP